MELTSIAPSAALGDTPSPAVAILTMDHATTDRLTALLKTDALGTNVVIATSHDVTTDDDATERMTSLLRLQARDTDLIIDREAARESAGT